MAIHHFDVARRLIGSEPVAVYGELQPPLELVRRERGGRAEFTFADGTRFGYTGSWCAPASRRPGTATGARAHPAVRRPGTGTTRPSRNSLPAKPCRPSWSTTPSRSPLAGRVRHRGPRVDRPAVRGPLQRHQRRHGRGRRTLRILGYAGPHRRRHHRRPHPKPWPPFQDPTLHGVPGDPGRRTEDRRAERSSGGAAGVGPDLDLHRGSARPQTSMVAAGRSPSSATGQSSRADEGRCGP